MTNFFNEIVTLYHDARTDYTVSFERYVLNSCSIQGQSVQRINGTIVNKQNAKTVYTKNLDGYTVSVGDFIVFGEVADVVTTAKEFLDLQAKYKDNGIKVLNIKAYRNGMNTDHIEIGE